MSDDTPIATGWLVKDGDGVRATLTDLLGVVTVIVGVPAIRDGVRGYALTATVRLPDHLKLPWEEDAPS
jgi:hypothetical protein